MAVVPAIPAMRRLGRYDLVEEIGRGMTAVVYRAHDPVLGRMVAVKVVDLPPRMSEADRLAFEERALAQARLAGRLSHPGIVIAHDAGKDPETGKVFIVFELVLGQSLAKRLDAGPGFDHGTALRLVQRVAEALHHAHSGGVIHRDVRPGNILILPSGDAKLMDLGAVQLETGRMTLTSMREAFGAPLYMSPEQAVGESVDARTDVFSLGTVAYRLLTGGDAFAGDDARSILAHVVHDTQQPPSSVARDLPPGVDQAIAHALEKSRKDRYQDAKCFAEDVEDILAGRWPRHSRERGSVGATERFRAALHEAQPRTAVEGTLRWRPRSVIRAVAGIAALYLVVAIELWRRVGEMPAVPPPASLPASSPPPAIVMPTLVADPALPSINEAPPAPTKARLYLEVRHTLKSGRLFVFVDGKQVHEQRLAARAGKSFLGVKVRAGRASANLELAPGRRRVRVEVLWREGKRSQTIAGDLKAAGTRRLVARLSRLSKSLSLEWQ